MSRPHAPGYTKGVDLVSRGVILKEKQLIVIFSERKKACDLFFSTVRLFVARYANQSGIVKIGAYYNITQPFILACESGAGRRILTGVRGL